MINIILNQKKNQNKKTPTASFVKRKQIIKT